ncbi:MAG: hypothetical protein ABNH00_14610 [Dokdonia sp.]|jgi:hypothetical protein|nr:hypothetical protein [Cytophagaceae bacterium]
MRLSRLICYAVILFAFTNCASSYKTISPKTLIYVSKTATEDVALEYKYNLLDKKYKKKEDKKGIKLVAVKITNNSGKDLTFGKDLKLVYENGDQVFVLDNDRVYNTLRQKPASYLWYLLLTPTMLNTTSSNSSSSGIGEETNSIPIGLVIGPGLTAGNMIAASSANKKFEEELMIYNIYGTLIKNGATEYGLIGIDSDFYEALKIKVER